MGAAACEGGGAEGAEGVKNGTDTARLAIITPPMPLPLVAVGGGGGGGVERGGAKAGGMGDGDFFTGGGGGREVGTEGTGGGALGGLGGAAERGRTGGGGGGAGDLRRLDVCCGMLGLEPEGRRVGMQGAEGGGLAGDGEEELGSLFATVMSALWCLCHERGGYPLCRRRHACCAAWEYRQQRDRLAGAPLPPRWSCCFGRGVVEGLGRN